jgi:hypothetical protein
LGSGIISKEYAVKSLVFSCSGPQTQGFLLILGYVVPEIYGDPHFITQIF